MSAHRSDATQSPLCGERSDAAKPTLICLAAHAPNRTQYHLFRRRSARSGRSGSWFTKNQDAQKQVQGATLPSGSPEGADEGTLWAGGAVHPLHKMPVQGGCKPPKKAPPARRNPPSTRTGDSVYF
ncbi:MAG: hypothetical protein IKN55_12600 [Oscillospiraceae bacterium]|nr:hypothetical protein [Oscillospiraceae bacterium]